MVNEEKQISNIVNDLEDEEETEADAADDEEEKIEIEETKRKIVELASEFQLQLEKQNITRCCAICEEFADICREDTYRTPLGETGVVPALVKFFLFDNDEAKRTTARVLGNICFDNEENRERVLSAGGVEPILLTIRDSSNANVKKTCAGSIGNFVVKNEKIRDMVLNDFGGYEILASQIEKLSDNELVVFMCTKAIININYGIGSKLIEKGLLQLLLTVAQRDLQQSSNSGNNNAEEAELEDDDLSPSVETAFEELVSISEEDELKSQFSVKGCIPSILKLTTYSNVNGKKSASKLLSNLMLDDACMNDCYKNNGIDVTLRLSNSADPAVRLNGLMALGNLARTESNCVEMVTLGVGKQLLKILDKEAKESHEDREVIKRIQLILGAFKNLSMPTQNRVKLSDIGLIEAVVPLLKSKNDAIQFYSTSVIRMLIRQSFENATKVLNCGGLQSIIELSESGISHLYIESSRVIVNFMDLSEDMRREVVKLGGSRAFLNLLNSEHLSLQVEGLKALSILSKDKMNREKLFNDFSNKTTTTSTNKTIEDIVANDNEDEKESSTSEEIVIFDKIKQWSGTTISKAELKNLSVEQQEELVKEGKKYCKEILELLENKN